jgi:hypothetical protein
LQIKSERAKLLTLSKVAGGILILAALVGYCTVADEFHHFGEFLGVTCILASGIILLIKDSKIRCFKHLALEWISVSLIFSIPFGGILLDNMPLGIAIGLSVGIIMAIVIGKKKGQILPGK